MAREELFMNAINEALDQAMEKDDEVVLLGEDISGGADVKHLEEANEDAWCGTMGVTKGLMPKYGRDRVIDTPLLEIGYMSGAVRTASTRLRPVQAMKINDIM